ncbi:hypothetical protein AwWohl_02000 [Gammaproteobacteria bacterium]|nr:hypothetical protein AwWohl_02000 [Gammaproteobacteria bacterium]
MNLNQPQRFDPPDDFLKTSLLVIILEIIIFSLLWSINADLIQLLADRIYLLLFCLILLFVFVHLSIWKKHKKRLFQSIIVDEDGLYFAHSPKLLKVTWQQIRSLNTFKNKEMQLISYQDEVLISISHQLNNFEQLAAKIFEEIKYPDVELPCTFRIIPRTMVIIKVISFVVFALISILAFIISPVGLVIFFITSLIAYTNINTNESIHKFDISIQGITCYFRFTQRFYPWHELESIQLGYKTTKLRFSKALDYQEIIVNLRNKKAIILHDKDAFKKCIPPIQLYRALRSGFKSQFIKGSKK